MDDNTVTWTNERRKLSDLHPWERNPRQIKTDQAKRLVESFDQFGQVETLAIGPDGEVYNGHQRLNVLMAEDGGDYEVDVRVASRPLSEKEREKLTIYLHKGAAGEWDFDILANEFELDDLLEWGFEKKELDLDLWAGEPAEDPGAQLDKAEELREKWGVETGQLWQLGEHRLVCGDCTDKAVVERVMDSKASITFTSPPYNAGVSAQLSGNTSIDDNLYKDEYNDNQKPEIWLELMREFTAIALTWSGYVFVNVQSLSGNKKALIEYWFEFVDNYADVAIWDKKHAAPQLAQRVMDSRFEFVIIFSQDGKRTIGTNDFRGMVHNVYDGTPQRHNEYASSHAATFPVDLPEHFIKTFTNLGESIYEPFLGTGTTLIACERLGRKCRAIEISPAYCAVAIQRWVDMTGREPVLISEE